MIWITAVLALSQWLTPIPEAEVLRGFAPPAQSWAAGHRGIDFAAAPGTAVHAIGPGVVVFAGLIAGKAVVSVEHRKLGLRSTYEPVTARVQRGDAVLAGEVIGAVAASGSHCAASCLHLGLKDPERGTYRNPFDLLNEAFAVLKPLHG